MARPRESLRRRVYLALEGGRLGGPAGGIVEAVLIALIVLNVAAYTMQSVPAFAHVHHTSLVVFEFVSIAVFAVEYALDPGLGEVAAVGKDGDGRAVQSGLHGMAAQDRDIDRLDNRGDGDGAKRAGPGLVRRQRRPEPRSADEITDDERAGVGRPNREEHADDDPGAMGRAAQRDQRQQRDADIERAGALPERPLAGGRGGDRHDDGAGGEQRPAIIAVRPKHGHRERGGDGQRREEEGWAEDALAHHAVPFADRGGAGQRAERGDIRCAAEDRSDCSGGQQTAEQGARHPIPVEADRAKPRRVIRRMWHVGAHATAFPMAPNWRSRWANCSSAFNSSSRPKSGHSVSTNRSSA